MNKKIILGLGTLTVVIAPVITVVSCGNEGETETGSGIQPVIPGAKVVTTNLDGVHFECVGFDNYMVVDGTKITPEELENFNPSTFVLSGGSASQIQSMFANNQMPVLRVINAPDSSAYYTAMNMPQPTLPQGGQEVIPGTAQGNGVRGTTIAGYSGDIPHYNIDGKWYTDQSHMIAGTNAVEKIAKAGNNVYASDVVNGIGDIRDVTAVTNLDVTTLPDSINIDGVMYPKFTHVPSSTTLTTPGHFDSSVAITDAGATPFALPNTLYEVDGLFFETKDEAALHMGYIHEDSITDESSFQAFITREGITGFKVQESENDWRTTKISGTQAEGYQANIYSDARNSEYFSINRDSYGNCYAIDDNEKFANNLNQGDLIALNPITVDDTFKSSHPVITIAHPTIQTTNGKTTGSTETSVTYTYRTTIDGDALTTPGFFQNPPADASATPFDLSTIKWMFEGKYYTTDESFMKANNYQIRYVYDNHGSPSFIDQVRVFVQTTAEIPPKYNVGDKITIDSVEYTIA